MIKLSSQAIKDMLFWILFILIVGLSLYVLMWTKTEPYKCISSPYTYTIGLMEQANNDTVICRCNTLKKNSAILLTREGFKTEEYYSNLSPVTDRWSLMLDEIKIDV